MIVVFSLDVDDVVIKENIFGKFCLTMLDFIIMKVEMIADFLKVLIFRSFFIIFYQIFAFEIVFDLFRVTSLKFIVSHLKYSTIFIFHEFLISSP